MAKLNTTTYFVDTAAQRDAEYPDTPFQNAGMNLGGSCAPGIGINSGDTMPKASDWARIDHGVAGLDALADSQIIGGTPSAINGILAVDKAVFAFVEAPAEVAIDAQITTAEGFALFNKSDKVLAAGEYMWGQGTDTG
jgi:hypothetical protein